MSTKIEREIERLEDQIIAARAKRDELRDKHGLRVFRTLTREGDAYERAGMDEFQASRRIAQLEADLYGTPADELARHESNIAEGERLQAKFGI